MYGPPYYTDPPEDDDRIERRAAELEEQYANDPDKLREIDVGASESLNPEHYEGIFSALADLAGVDAEKLIGSDALARVLWMADDMEAVRIKHVKERAQADAEEESKSWPRHYRRNAA